MDTRQQACRHRGCQHTRAHFLHPHNPLAEGELNSPALQDQWCEPNSSSAREEVAGGRRRGSTPKERVAEGRGSMTTTVDSHSPAASGAPSLAEGELNSPALQDQWCEPNSSSAREEVAGGRRRGSTPKERVAEGRGSMTTTDDSHSPAASGTPSRAEGELRRGQQ